MAEEDFDIPALAAFLHLTPAQVKKMAERDRLPGRRISGQWRFSQAEIHSWFEDRIGLSDEKGLTEVERVLGLQSHHQIVEQWGIPEMLSPDRIAVPLAARTKNRVIEKICDMSSQSGVLWDPAKMAEAIRNREELHPTALENGVALLHPRRPMPSIMGEPFLSLGITTAGIPFGGPRGVLTDVFFLIGSNDEAQHLRLLARLSRLLYVEELLDQIRKASDSRSVWQMIADFDRELE